MLRFLPLLDKALRKCVLNSSPQQLNPVSVHRMSLSVRSRYADRAGRSHGPSESGVQHGLYGPLYKTGCGLAEAGQPKEKLTNKLPNACKKRKKKPLRAAPSEASSTSSTSSRGVDFISCVLSDSTLIIALLPPHVYVGVSLSLRHFYELCFRLL